MDISTVTASPIEVIVTTVTILLALASLVLSVVALIVTVLGFFASLRFYREGMRTQYETATLLAKVEEKAEGIRTQVSGVTERAIDLLASPSREQGRAQARAAPAAGDDAPTPVGLLTEEIGDETRPGGVLALLFLLRGLQFTNVFTETGHVYFRLGADQGFSLFDGGGRIVYYGHFYQLDVGSIVARVRILIGRLGEARRRVEEGPEDPRREDHLRYLDMIEVLVLLPEGVDEERFLEVVERFQPEGMDILVEAWTPERLRQELEAERDRMRL